MDQNKVIVNITNTVAVFGLSVSLLGCTNTFQVQSMGNNQHDYYKNYGLKSIIPNENYYLVDKTAPLERESLALFGAMRDATIEEQRGVQTYLEEISTDTGVNFFDLC